MFKVYSAQYVRFLKIGHTFNYILLSYNLPCSFQNDVKIVNRFHTAMTKMHVHYIAIFIKHQNTMNVITLNA